jgi:hypothetical protein
MIAKICSVSALALVGLLANLQAPAEARKGGHGRHGGPAFYTSYCGGACTVPRATVRDRRTTTFRPLSSAYGPQYGTEGCAWLYQRLIYTGDLIWEQRWNDCMVGN